MNRFALVLALAAVLAAPAQASADTVVTLREYVQCPVKGSQPCSTIRELSARSEGDDANVMRIAVDADVVISDEAHPVRSATPACAQVGERAVRCAGTFSSVGLNAGGGPDRVVAGGSHVVSAYGGEGDDEVRAGPGGPFGARLGGGAGADRVVGGPNPETLSGGPGADVVEGGEGGDSLDEGSEGGSAGDDLLDGGPGRDTVTYAGRQAPVDVDLERRAPNGEAGETDTIVAVEGDLHGGAGDDVLRGSAIANRIHGGRGRDLLDGRGGDDELTSGETFDGGPGDDQIHPGTTGRAIGCGDGRDVVMYPEARAVIAGDCEVVDGLLGHVRFRLRPLTTLRGVVLRLVGECGIDGFRRCPVSVTLRAAPGGSAGGPAPGTLLGRVRGRLPRRGRAVLTLRLSRRGRAVLRRHGSVRARVDAGLHFARGQRDRSAFTTLLRAP